jgi:Ca2+-binding EF-hand superfamily protein
MSGKSSFSEDLIGEFQEAFMLFDTKGDGMIPVSLVTNHFSYMKIIFTKF